MTLFVQTDRVKDMNAASIKNMEVHLNALDVAKDIFL